MILLMFSALHSLLFSALLPKLALRSEQLAVCHGIYFKYYVIIVP